MTESRSITAPSRRRVVQGIGAVAAGVAAPAVLTIRSAYAAYPDRAVKIVVANTPGGPSDIVGRIVAAALQESTGKTFIIENRGGAGGNIGMGFVAHADPDGYTILLATNTLSVNVGLYNHLPFDPRHDFVAVCELAGVPNIFVVRKESPAKTMRQFIDIARASPDKFNVSVPPIGTTPQLQAALLKARENLPKLEEVVFKGGGDALQALLTNTVQLASNSLGPVVAAHSRRHHPRSGIMRRNALAGFPRYSDHGRSGLQGLRLRHRHGAAGAGQDAARIRQMAGDRDAEGDVDAADEAEALQERLPGAAAGRRGGLGAHDQGDGRHSRPSSTARTSRSSDARPSATTRGRARL